MPAPAVPPAPLLQLSEPLPAVVQTPAALREAAARLAAGHGPVALDAERASGHRYSQRAYLVQARREGTGTVLVDPVADADPLQYLSPLAAVLAGPEWILHAASQDLVCLAEVGLRPSRLFDTELAARLLGLPRVGLAALVEDLLGLRLKKEHSAVDWSTRPLPQSWLEYAALDVEVLGSLRDLLVDQLDQAGKREWAEQEFTALLAFTGPAPRLEPWRRTSGIQRVRGRRPLAAVREVWLTRDEIAAEQDVTPGRVLSDDTIVEMARAMPIGRTAMRGLPGIRHRQGRRHLDRWVAAVERAAGLPEPELPTVSARHDGPPPPRAWGDRNPAAAARLAACRAVVAALSERHVVPAENLIPPDAVRRLAWEPPQPFGRDTVRAALVASGARPWQVDLLADRLAESLAAVTDQGRTDAGRTD
ncbi:MAG: ribonuclease [Nocardioidaceae bacterium]|nr:ribonuclease [Nocardioidaceae bacterium]